MDPFLFRVSVVCTSRPRYDPRDCSHLDWNTGTNSDEVPPVTLWSTRYRLWG